MFVEITHGNGDVNPRNLPRMQHAGQISVNADTFSQWIDSTRFKTRRQVYGKFAVNPGDTVGGEFNRLIDCCQVVYWSRLP